MAKTLEHSPPLVAAQDLVAVGLARLGPNSERLVVAFARDVGLKLLQHLIAHPASDLQDEAGADRAELRAADVWLVSRGHRLATMMNSSFVAFFSSVEMLPRCCMGMRTCTVLGRYTLIIASSSSSERAALLNDTSHTGMCRQA